MDEQTEFAFPPAVYGAVLQRLDTEARIYRLRLGGDKASRVQDGMRLQCAYQDAVRYGLDAWQEPIVFADRTFSNPSELVTALGEEFSEVVKSERRWA